MNKEILLIHPPAEGHVMLNQPQYIRFNFPIGVDMNRSVHQCTLDSSLFVSQRLFKSKFWVVCLVAVAADRFRETREIFRQVCLLSVCCLSAVCLSAAVSHPFALLCSAVCVCYQSVCQQSVKVGCVLPTTFPY